MENWIIVLLLAGALTYYMSSGNTSEEINYQVFINQYLAKNQVKMITISEDKTNDSFKYRA